MRDLWHRLGEKVDAALVRGQVWFFGLLACAALLVAVLGAVVITVLGVDLGGGPIGFGEAIWQSLLRTLDTGQLAQDRGAAALVTLGIAVAGLVLVSTLISLVNNKVQRRVEVLDRGRTPVPLEDHYVVLGWTDITPKVLEQLHASADGRRPPDTVVLGLESCKVMRQRIDEHRRSLAREASARRRHRPTAGADGIRRHREAGTWPADWPRLRTGNPADKRDLDRLARIDRARAVIVLSPDLDGLGEGSTLGSAPRASSPEEATGETVKTVLAVVAGLEDHRNGGPVGHSGGAAGNGSCHAGDERSQAPAIVVEVAHSPDTAGLLKRRLRAKGANVVVVDSARLRAGLMAQVSRCPGLAEVYKDLYDFQGNEFHVVPVPEGVLTFGEAVVALEDACAIGVVRSASPDGRAWGEVDLWPEWDEPLDGSTRLLVLSETDRTPTPGPEREDRPGAPLSGSRRAGREPSTPGPTLVLGWRNGAVDLLHSLEATLPAGSTIDVVADADAPSGLPPTVASWVRRPVNAWLDEHEDRDRYEHAIILSDDTLDPTVADAETLLAFLALRPPGRAQRNPETVVAELRRRASKHLVAAHESTDLIVTGALTADALVQYAVRPETQQVFDRLLGHDEFEIDFVPVERLELPDRPTFRDLARQVGERGEVVLGYRVRVGAHSDGSPDRVLVLNPRKSDPLPAATEDAVVLLRTSAGARGPSAVATASHPVGGGSAPRP